jgi:hypothetical protein
VLNGDVGVVIPAIHPIATYVAEISQAGASIP